MVSVALHTKSQSIKFKNQDKINKLMTEIYPEKYA